MNQSLQIANRFREVILNGTWIANTNFKDQLVDLDWQLATKKVASLNTIADLAQHIHYYISGILNVFNGGSLNIKDQFSFNFPAIESQEQWNLFLNRFWKDTEEFARKVEAMSDDELNSVFVDAKYGSYHRNIEAMIEHSYYHLGQIVLIKKMLINSNL